MINESPQDIMIKIRVIDKQAEKKLKKRIYKANMKEIL